MKRFALVVTLLACCLMTSTAMAQSDAVVIESKSVSLNAATTVGIFLENSVDLQSFVVPLEIRSVSGGAFWASFDDVATKAGFTLRGGGDATDVKIANIGMVNYTDPDQLLISWIKGFFSLAPIPPGSDGGTPTVPLFLTVNGSVGDFELDTLLFPPASTLQYVDDPGGNNVPIQSFTKGVITINPNACPSGGALADAGPIVLVAGVDTGNNSIVGYDDSPENDLQDAFQASGPGSTDASGNWSWSPGCADIGNYTVEIERNDDQHAGPGSGCTVLSFDVQVVAPPINASCVDVSVHWGDLASQQIGANPNACGPLQYSGGAPGSVDGSGLWSYQTDCGDLGTQQVTVTVDDAASQSEDCIFDLEVTNSPPTCASPGNQIILFGNLLSINLTGSGGGDGDGATFSLVSIAPLPTGAQPTVSGGGVFNWTPDVADAPGNYTVTFEVSDGCESVQCAFNVEVQFEAPYEICVVDKDSLDGGAGFPASQYSCALNGRNHKVYVYSEPNKGFPDGDGGFDFLICYDQSGLVFQQAERGPDLDPTFEYFTYRTGMFGGNCTGPCPDGFVQVVGVADLNNAVEPDAGAFQLEGYIICLEFFVTSDREFIGQCLEVGFCSYDCTDNVISDKSGNRIAIPLSGAHYGFDYDVNECLEGIPGKGEPERKVIFCSGWICVCPPPDDRGDINLNGIANEVGDYVLYTNYFIYGDIVWDATYADAQILASDINNDGLVLTVGDLVYLMKVITGDADPFPESGEGGRITPFVNSVDVMTDLRTDRAVVTMNSSEEVGAALLVYNYTGTVGTPTLEEGSAMKIRTHAANGELRVLIHSMTGATLQGAVSIPVDGNLELTEASVADANGAMLTVNAAARQLPTTFALDQNYPNPFNAGTVIKFALPDATDWSLKIYNVAGQLVRTFDGYSEPGHVSVSWDATSDNGASVATGVYFYKLEAGNKTATKKMMIVK